MAPSLLNYVQLLSFMYYYLLFISYLFIIAMCSCYLVERQALAVRLDLCFRSVYFFFIREYLPNRLTYLNKSLHDDGKWLGIEHGGFEFLNF